MTSPTADRFIGSTLDLIAEKGGSQGVNLREVARRVGCAHTNLYNYFDSFDDLLWAAFRRVLDDYASHLFRDLDSLAAEERLEALIANLVAYPQSNPGWYRFIGSDPISSAGFPADILDTVLAMKQQLFEAFRSCSPGSDQALVDQACDIVYAYIDGESFNLINERVVPGEDVAGRVVGNAIRLFGLLTRPD
ncbi:MAG: TetR/AcrR family transcriptional regulator [Acidimicrobiia bacterium]|nr:TetR/AcrR family transcriptional regulator [Acidimicrobiia bacterium]